MRFSSHFCFEKRMKTAVIASKTFKKLCIESVCNTRVDVHELD
jgi:hypothetical protein